MACRSASRPINDVSPDGRWCHVTVALLHVDAQRARFITPAVPSSPIGPAEGCGGTSIPIRPLCTTNGG